MGSSRDKIKVFLIDDDPVFIHSLEHTLKNDSTEIKTFMNGEKCLEKLVSESPEVVVVDYYIDGDTAGKKAMNGIQILNKIKTASPETEVIMLSAQDNINVALDTIKYGAYDYIPKGQSAFIKVKNDIAHIIESRNKENDYNGRFDRVKILNIAIIAIVIILYILNRML